MWNDALRFMMVFSHVVFLLPIVLCFWNRFYAQALIWLAVTVVSTMYHSCDVYPGTCLMDLLTHIRVDTLVSYTVVISVAMMISYPLLPIPFHLEFGLAGAFFLANILLGMFVPPGHFTQFLFAVGAGFTLLIGSLIAVFFGKDERRERKKRKRDWFCKRVVVPMYVSGVASMILGAIMYICPEIFGDTVYPVTHLFWHLCVGVGAAMVLYSIWPYSCEVKGCGRKYRKRIYEHWKRDRIYVNKRRRRRRRERMMV